MSNFVRPTVVECLRALYVAGETRRRAAVLAACSKRTVERYYAIFRAEGLVSKPCGCGRPARHKGMCPYMLARPDLGPAVRRQGRQLNLFAWAGIDVRAQPKAGRPVEIVPPSVAALAADVGRMPAVIAERERLRAITAGMGIPTRRKPARFFDDVTAVLMGDPSPERSALAMRAHAPPSG
jgi:hypothetical protein